MTSQCHMGIGILVLVVLVRVQRRQVNYLLKRYFTRAVVGVETTAFSTASEGDIRSICFACFEISELRARSVPSKNGSTIAGRYTRSMDVLSLSDFNWTWPDAMNATASSRREIPSATSAAFRCRGQRGPLYDARKSRSQFRR